MTRPENILLFISKVLNYIAGISLSIMMLLTVTDIILRAGGYPIIGTYEIVSLLLALVIGFAIPQVSLNKGHVYMEFLLDKMSGKWKNIMNTFTRVLCILLFAVIGYKMFSVGAVFHASGEVTATVKLPFYHIAYGVAVCCLLECLVFVLDIVKIWSPQHE
ncbi:MAG: TRAP transporter small permease [Spirochaetes bacterium]|nr:TRAP transporter small permease [Spirochaetota bacterium]